MTWLSNQRTWVQIWSLPLKRTVMKSVDLGFKLIQVQILVLLSRECYLDLSKLLIPPFLWWFYWIMLNKW